MEYKCKTRKLKFIGLRPCGRRLYAASCYIRSDGGEMSWERCAVKKTTSKYLFGIIPRKYATEPNSETMNEIEALKKLRGHEFILNMYTCFQTRTTVHIVTELAELGDLSEVLRASNALPQHAFVTGLQLLTPRFPAFMVRFLMAPIFAALAHMHAKGLIHRDLKPMSVVMFADGTPKLSDFGCTIEISYDGEGLNAVDPTALGSDYYNAPETVCLEKFNETLDTWQMGISLLVLVFGWGPYHFRKPNVYWTWDEKRAPPNDIEITSKWFLTAAKMNRDIDNEILEKVNLDRKQLDGEPDDEWQAFRTFATRCFTRDVKERPTCEQLLQDEYLAPVADAWKSKNFFAFRKESEFLDKVVTSMEPFGLK